MTQAVIVVGQTFQVTLETSLASLGTYNNPRVYYKKPDGTKGYLTPTISGTTMVATVTPSINPLTGRAGKWSFYPYVEGSGTIVYRGETDHVIVSEEYQQ
jgi:hypothetical protein